MAFMKLVMPRFYQNRDTAPSSRGSVRGASFEAQLHAQTGDVVKRLASLPLPLFAVLNVLEDGDQLFAALCRSSRLSRSLAAQRRKFSIRPCSVVILQEICDRLVADVLRDLCFARDLRFARRRTFGRRGGTALELLLRGELIPQMAQRLTGEA